MAIQADVTAPGDVARMVGEIDQRWDGVDVLVHNALIPFAITSFAELTWEQLGGKLDRELRAAFLMTKAVVPGMISRGYGRLVYLSTGLSRRPRDGMITLGTAKAALDQFVRFIALELAPHGITANLVAPATVEGTTVSPAVDAGADARARRGHADGTARPARRRGQDGGVLRERRFRLHHRPLPSRSTAGLQWIEWTATHQIGRRAVPMHTIDLAYVGRGIHEELVAYVADQEGYYADEGVHVAIRDGDSWETERLRHCATIGLGRTLTSRLTDGIGWTALSVNTHRPLFWFLGVAKLTSMADLRGRRLAVHAAHTAPGCFARIVLRKHGLDPDHDLKCVVRPPGEYQMDLRRLRDGSIDAAYVGSTLSPEQVAEEEGFHLLAWVGDHFQIPTVGVAVDPVHIPLDSPALQALVRAHKRALRTMADEPRLAVDYIASFLDRLTRDEAQRYYERYIGPYFTADGHVDLNIARQGIDAVAAELGVASVAADQIHQLAGNPRMGRTPIVDGSAVLSG